MAGWWIFASLNGFQVWLLCFPICCGQWVKIVGLCFCWLFGSSSHRSFTLVVVVGMAISARLAGTRLGSTLMGRFLPVPIKNKVGFGLYKKKNPKRVRVEFGFW